MSQYKYLSIKRKSPQIAIATLNRCNSKNIFHSQLLLELTRAVKQLSDDEEVSAVILTGEEDAFSVGADIKEMTGFSVSQAYEMATKIKILQTIIIQSPKPFIAAINGYCFGSGLELALVCDFRIASHNATFGLPQINLGIIPGGGGITRLVEVIGRTAATKMIFTGEPILASKALELGLLSDLLDDPLEEAIVLAESLSAKSKLALETAKELINHKFWQDRTNLEKEIQAFSLLFDYPDSVEGMGAFLEQRKPFFKSK